VAGGGLDGSNYLMIAVVYGIGNECNVNQNGSWTNNVDPSVPFYMDTKRDDGIPTTGAIQVVRTGGAPVYGSSLVYSSLTCALSATAYNLTGNYNPQNPWAGGSAGAGSCTTRIKVDY